MSFKQSVGLPSLPVCPDNEIQLIISLELPFSRLCTIVAQNQDSIMSSTAHEYPRSTNTNRPASVRSPTLRKGVKKREN